MVAKNPNSPGPQAFLAAQVKVMGWASYEDMCAEIPEIVPEDVLCIQCEQRAPEPGADHCQACLDNLNESARGLN